MFIGRIIYAADFQSSEGISSFLTYKFNITHIRAAKNRVVVSNCVIRNKCACFQLV